MRKLIRVTNIYTRIPSRVESDIIRVIKREKLIIFCRRRSIFPSSYLYRLYDTRMKDFHLYHSQYIG